MNPPTKKENELGFPACLLLSTPASFQRLHFYFDKLQVFFVFLMNSIQRNALNCLFRSSTTCFSLYRRQKPKPAELQYAELGELTGRGQKATMPRVSGTDTVYTYIKS